ncbi:hypothetical protein TNCT_575411 [Trichonephila clavata]|uniref:Uncharacterized protein n=1 Tax=Trichonephila clavata TaxID=2740835 RepID=A0A8X6LMP5_TRICU|nr:hypothetical protein TNCT_575411 [Trichonephila clavata]
MLAQSLSAVTLSSNFRLRAVLSRVKADNALSPLCPAKHYLSRKVNCLQKILWPFPSTEFATAFRLEVKWTELNYVEYNAV